MTACTMGQHYADLAYEVVATLLPVDLPDYPVARAIQASSFADARTGYMATDADLRAVIREALSGAMQ